MKSFILLFLLIAPIAPAQEIVRHAGSGALPIASAVEVGNLIFHSGVIPSPANEDAEQFSPEYWGDTQAQTENVLAKLQASLQAKGYDMADVVKLTVFLVADPELGSMDFAGMMNGYTQFWGEASDGQLPARSVVEAAGLVRRGMLVEIEAIGAK